MVNLTEGYVSLLVRRRLHAMSEVYLCATAKKIVTDVAFGQTVGLKTILLRLCVSIYAMKMLAKEKSCVCTHRGAVDL